MSEQTNKNVSRETIEDKIEFSISLFEILVLALCKALHNGNHEEIRKNYNQLYSFLIKIYTLEETMSIIDYVYNQCYTGYTLKNGKWVKVSEGII